MENSKELIEFKEVTFLNRWKQPFYARVDSWTIFGVSIFWHSTSHYKYKICFFGLEIHLHFNRTFK